MNAFLTRQQVLQAQKRHYAEAHVPELGGKIRLQSLSASATMRLQAIQTRKEKGEDVTNDLILLALECSLVDGDGERICRNREEAVELLDAISIEVALKVLETFVSVVNRPKAPEPSGNSEASQLDS